MSENNRRNINWHTTLSTNIIIKEKQKRLQKKHPILQSESMTATTIKISKKQKWKNKKDCTKRR